MIDFNYRFEKIRDRIPIVVKPTPRNAFLHYLGDFSSDIVTTLQTWEEIPLQLLMKFV